MCEFRIIDHNYAFDPTVSLTPSSVDSAFPVSNFRSFQRAKVWRSSGNYIIDEDNQMINFAEGGPELTTTVTAGTYNATTLCAAIKTALELIGALTYTVTWSPSTGKFTVSGSSDFSLLFDTGSDAGSSIKDAIGYGDNDYSGSYEYTGARIAIHTEESVVIDIKTTESIDSFIILFDQLVGNKLSHNATVKIQGNATNEWSAPAVDTALSFDDTFNTFSKFYTSAQAYRYWRLLIVDSQNPNLYVEIPKIVIGMGTQLGQNPEIGFSESLNDLSKAQETPYGHRYSDLYPIRKTTEFNYGALTEADTLTLQTMYRRLGNTTPLVVCLDPLAELFDKDRYITYGYIKGDHKSVNKFYTYFDTQLSIEECL